VGTRATWPLVGRAEELDLLVAATVDGPASLVVAGPVGVGKSRLVAELLERAAAAGHATALVRATRSTATIPFGPFAPWAPDGSGAAAADRLQVLRSISAALVDERVPVVIAVDDAHLLDAGSAALLLHLVVNTPARVVATVRSGEPCPDAVAALWKEGLAERADLQSLSETETADLLEHVLGGPLDQTARRRLWALTEGTPLYLREVVRTAVDQGVLAREGGRWCWRGALSGSDRLHELMRDHLARAGPDERRVLDLLACGEPLPLQLVTHLGHRSAVAAAEEHGFVATDLVPDGPQVRLAHPLYGEVLRAEMPALAAREHQAVLASAALAVGWHDRDPLRVAVWCLDGGGGLAAPGVLLAAARRALALSEWELAERLARAAGDDNPQAVLTRAIAVTPLVRWDEATGLLARLAVDSLAGDVGPEVAGEAARVHAWLLFWRPGASPSLADVRAATQPLPASVRPVAFVHSAFQALLAARPDDAATLAAEAVAAAGGTPAPHGTGQPADPDRPSDLRVQALSVVAFARGLQGRTAEALAAAEAGLPHVPALLQADPVPGNPAGAMPAAYCLALVLDGRLADAAATAGMLLDAIGEEGPPALRALAATLAGRMALFEGRLDEARRLGDLGLSICRETRQLPASHWPAAVLATAAAQQGDPATAAWALDWVEAASSSAGLYEIECALARSWLLAAQGHVSAARARAAEIAERAAGAGLHALATLALVDLARLGAPGDAADRLTTLAPPADGRYPALLHDHLRALAAGDADDLDRSSSALEGVGALLLAAEAAAGAATGHRRAGRRSSATAAQGRARTLAARCGGARTPALRDLGTGAAVATLTDREREVAGLAGQGLSNREIADSLYVSVRTVNTHLHRAYAKLGVNDRTQLALLLGPADGRPAPG
jgi:DNA-binding CsgD family transcriptional regulator/type II secretory pathway predicted ATPase ExeA